MEYTHAPSPGSIRLQSMAVNVPKLYIVFGSKGHSYRRTILPASGTTLLDEISECRHLLRKKHTFAVCETCGVAKCEGDILVDRHDRCFCKKHAPQDLKESGKSRSIRGRLHLSLGRRN